MPLKPTPITRRSPSRTASQTQINRSAIFPAPTKGLNATSPLTSQDPLTAVTLNNWWVRRYGVELRGGYKRWTTNLGGIGTEADINTLMVYQPSPGASAYETKLFACGSDEKIYDVTDRTAEATVPASVVTCAGQTRPGEFSYVNFTNSSASYLCACAAGYGYITYDAAGGWTSRTAGITGAGAAYASSFDFVTSWKNRLWFIREGTTQAFYLDANAITGNSALFDFGPLLKHGGALAGITSWTVDSGDGVDDKLIIIGTGGDVLIYEGTDPASANTFSLAGTWFIGTVPEGRRFFSRQGGDVGIVTERGVEYMSKLMSARGLIDPQSVNDTPAYRYGEVLGAEVKDTRGQRYWQILPHVAEQSVIITTPYNLSTRSKQYVFSMLGTAWSTFTSLPMVCMAQMDGELYFGMKGGKVGQAFTANTNDELYDGTAGTSVIGDIQTAYVTDPDNPVALKRPQLIMPMFQSAAAPAVRAQINTEWATRSTAGSPSFTGDQGDLWDTGEWDTAHWSDSDAAFFSWLGADGLGCYASLRMSVIALPGTMFTSWKLIYIPGGIM